MSEQDVETVRRSYEAYRRADYVAALECFAPDVVYEVDQEAPARGPDEVLRVWKRWAEAWEEIDTVALEFIDAGDAVVIAVRYSGRGRTSGIEFTELRFDVYTMRDGKCVRKHEFKTRVEALEAAGLRA